MNRFLVWQWVDGCVVFDRESGNTHAFGPQMAGAFLAAHRSAQSPAQIEQAFNALLSASINSEAGSETTLESPPGRLGAVLAVA